jgi:preprotein translocase subunit SecD
MVDDSAQPGPEGADRVPLAAWGGGTSGALWLKREGGMEGPFVADARVDVGVDGTSSVRLTFTPEGREEFAALTRASIGHSLAFVLNGRVIVSALIGAEIDDGRIEINAAFTEVEARALSEELIATNREIGP